MSKLFARKWRLASGSGFALALAIDGVGKQAATARALAIARQTAGLPIERREWLAAAFPNGLPESLFLVVMTVAAVCWGVAVWRREPGSSLPLAVLAVVCVGSFFISV